MKLVICGSMRLSKRMKNIADKLITLNHEVVLPEFTDYYSELNSQEEMHSESVKHKKTYDLITDYFHKIDEGDAILVVNDKLKGLEGYIGGNSFLEMGFAHVLNKPIYLTSNIPEVGYKDEIEAMKPIIIQEDFTKIK